LSNIKAFFQLKKLCKQNQYDIIHCHTPVGGVLGRLCVNRKKCKTKIIYTAHGFHFYKGAKLINWLLYYPIEKLLAHRANCIVTINDEDYQLASKKFNSHVKQIDGVGVNLMRFKPICKEEKTKIRTENGFSEDDFILVYCAQFIPRKNHKFLLEKISKLKNQISNIKLCLIGSGYNESEIRNYAAKLGLKDITHFMGYRTDVEKLYAMSDVLVSTSLQEGWSIGVIEGAACGIPALISKIRGHININILFQFSDNSFDEGLLNLYHDEKLRGEYGKYNIEYVKRFSIEHSLMQMSEIYKEFM
jgi:glycosyltransferase EpsD